MARLWDHSLELDPLPQDVDDATYAPRMSKAESVLDFRTSSATECHNKVRAFAGWPGSHGAFVLRDMKENKTEVLNIKILKTRVGLGVEPYEGDIGWGNDCMFVRCKGNSTLEIVELQCPNKRPVLIKDFRNGLQQRCIELPAMNKSPL